MEPQIQPWRGHIARYIEQNARPTEKFGHQPRLWLLCTEIAASHPEADPDILFAAAMLHDIGVFTGHRPEETSALEAWDMVGYALRILPPLLAEWHFPPQKIEPVLACIRTHQPHLDPRTIEATILRDADILEQLGAVGILRTVCKVGRDTRFPSFTPAVASLQRALDTLPPLLRLEASRTLAAPRIQIHREWLAAVNIEAGLLLL